MASTEINETGLHLTTEQGQQILAAAGQLVCAAVTGQPGTFPDPSLAGAADLLVSGTFVSLKRGKHLRGCCGGLVNPPLRLGKSLEDAAFRTALDDIRFPPVSPIELPYLTLEVWILYNPQRMQARGEERIQAVEVGRHGLVVERDRSRGLLLPGVPVEHGWHAKKFLQQVCVKAGLHPSSWQDDETSLSTFEGEVLRGKPAVPTDFVCCTGRFQQADLETYAEFCRSNILANLRGATPNYYLLGVNDGTVNGVVLSVELAEPADGIVVSQFSMRPGVPLQSTLYTLAQSAAQTLAERRIVEAELASLACRVSLFFDPALHGTLADPQLEGIDPQRRALLVMERSRSGLHFEPTATADLVLSRAASHAQVRSRAAASVVSLEVLSASSNLSVSSGPRPTRGTAIRPPGVAGQFYSDDGETLKKTVDELLEGERNPGPWRAAMVPHAGLRFSGRIAAGVFRQLQIPSTVIILGPKHTPLGVDWAVAPHQRWALPGCSIGSDPELARQLTEAIPGLELDAAAHQREHAIEVELPFLVRLAPQTRVVGIAIGHGDLEACRQFARGLAEVVAGLETPPLLLISSDMNHFATDEATRQLDEMALCALDSLDPEEVFETVTGNQISMCGVLPAVIVLETLRSLGWLSSSQRASYATSADVTGDTRRVVGYAGMLFR